MYRAITLTVGLALACLLTLQPQSAEAGKIGLSGEVNPEYKGHIFNSFAISAINGERDFQFWYERLMFDLFKKHFYDKLNAIQLHEILGKTSFDPNAKPFSTTQLLEDLKQKKIEVLVLFNISSDGGKNQTEIRTLQDALNATIENKFEPSSIRLYTYSHVTLYDVATGKIIWRGQGPLRAKLGVPKHLKKNAIIQTKYLYKYMVKAGLLPPSFSQELWSDEYNTD